LVPAPVVLVDAGFVESVIGAGEDVAGVLVSIVGMLVIAGALVSAIAGAGAGALVSAAGAVELVMLLSALLQPARAKGRLRVRRARREQ
jgi:hypothetical protein